MTPRIRRAFSLGGLSIVLRAGVASAQPASAPAVPSAPLSETLTGEALADYEAGRVLLRDHDAAAALVRFRSAYDSAHDPRLLANVALSEEELHHPARAATILTQLLAEGSPVFTPEQREQLRGLLDACVPSVGRLHVTVEPRGASVLVDGRAVAEPELAADVFVDAGPHEVRVTSAGLKDVVERVTVAAGARVEVDAKLLPEDHAGRLRVRTKAQAGIVVDGRLVATGSWDGRLPPGRHHIGVSATGMAPYLTDIELAENETRTLDVELAAERGVPVWLWAAGGAVLGAAIFVAADSVFR